MRVARWFGGLAIAAVWVCFTHAAETDGLWEMTIDQLLRVEVSAPSRAEQPIADAPTAVSVYGREELRAMGVHYLHELLDYVPGFQTSLDVAVAGQRHAFSSRGSVEFHSPGILVLRDGRRINDVYTRGAPLFARWISLEHVLRVEVIRGPGSSLYGSNAVVGVINMVTSGLDENYVLAGAGRLGQRRAALAWSEDLGEFRLEVQAEFLDDEGQTRAVFDRHDRSASSSDPRRFEDLGFNLSHGATTLSVHDQRRRFRDFHDVGGNVGNGLQRHEARQLSLALLHTWSTDRLTLRGTAEVRRADWDFMFLQAPAGSGPFQDGDFLLGGSLDQDILTLSLETTAELSDAHALSFGGEFIQGDLPRAQLVSTYDLTDPSNYYGEPRITSLRFARDARTRNRGLYLEHIWTASSHLRTRVGLRVDDDSFADTELSPRAGIDVDLGPGHRLSVLAGRAFRAPGLGELFLENQPVILGNPNLQPTSLDTYELGYRVNTARVLLALSLFRNDTDDAIVSEPTAADPGVAMFRNSGHQQTTGLEVELTFRVDDRTRLRASGSHLFKNDTNIVATPNRPAPEDFFARSFGALSLQRRQGPAEFHLGLRYRDALDALPRQGSLLRVDGRVSLQIGDETQLWFRASNLLDERYDSPASGAGLGLDAQEVLQREIPARGSEWSVGLERHF